LEFSGVTGSVTEHVLNALLYGHGKEHGTLRCSHYTFTAVDTTSFDEVKARCSKFDQKMSYRALDIGADVSESVCDV